MNEPFADLVGELRTLRKGRGLYVGQINERVGPALREFCGLSESDGPVDIRRKIAHRLVSLASNLPEDLRVALMAAFAIDPEARLPFYADRVRWAAAKIRRDDRTARRRIDEAIDRVVELAVSTVEDPDPMVSMVSTTSWYTEELRISVVLDRSTPEILEVRRIVAERNHLAEVDLAMTLATNSGRGQPSATGELAVDVFYGGLLTKKSLESQDRFGLVVTLPDELHRGSRHEFALRYRPSTSQLRPHFVCVPKHRCDHFELRVRFDLNRIPSRIWRLTNASQRDVTDSIPKGELIVPSAAGDVHTEFQQLIPGRAYGIRWDDLEVDGHGALTRTPGFLVMAQPGGTRAPDQFRAEV